MNIIDLFKTDQKELMEVVYKYLKGMKYDGKIIKTNNYLYAKGEIPILLVAHLDTVHKAKPIEIFRDTQESVMWSPEGIGGDDRCGVFAILTIISQSKPHLLFTTDEEIGCVGAKKFCTEYQMDLKKEIKYIVEIDRRGDGQAVFYQCGNKAFQDYILSYGFKKESGTCSDISELGPTYDIACVNLSAGYYKEHTTSEYVNLKHLCNTINKINNLIKDINKADFFDFQKTEYTYQYSCYDYEKKTKKNEEDEEEKENDCNELIDEYYKQMEEDYEQLSDREFLEYYGFSKPMTKEELMDY